MGERVGKRKRDGKGAYAAGLPVWGPQRRWQGISCGFAMGAYARCNPVVCFVSGKARRNQGHQGPQRHQGRAKKAVIKKSLGLFCPSLSLHTRLPCKAPYMLRRGDVSLARQESALPLLRFCGPHTPEVLPKHYSLLVMRPMGGENNGTHEAHETRPETLTG